MNKKVRTAILLLIVFSIGMVLHGNVVYSAQKNELYVSPIGSDKNVGSKKKPLKTIQKAVNIAKPGTTVYVRKGIYKEQVIIKKSGLKNASIIIKAYPKEKAIIDGRGLKVSWDYQGLVSIHNKSYVTIDGFEIKNYETRKEGLVPIGISISGSGKGIRILHNHIHHIETHHKNGNVSNFKVTYNILRRNDNIGIDVIGFEGVSPVEAFDQARNGIISNNTVYQISSYGNPAYGNQYAAGGIYVDGGKEIIIERNKVLKTI
ncbi:DUF1565 domain-containing protein [Ectobacillus funiculus]